MFEFLRRGPGELCSLDLQLSLSMPRVGVSRPHNATHDSRHVRERPERLALFLDGGVSVQCRATEVLAQRQRELVSRVTISQFASNTSRRVVGQWGGAGGACCEDHFAFCGELLGFAALDSA